MIPLGLLAAAIIAGLLVLMAYDFRKRIQAERERDEALAELRRYRASRVKYNDGAVVTNGQAAKALNKLAEQLDAWKRGLS